MRLTYECQRCGGRVGPSNHVMPLPGWHFCYACLGIVLQAMLDDVAQGAREQLADELGVDAAAVASRARGPGAGAA